MKPAIVIVAVILAGCGIDLPQAETSRREITVEQYVTRQQTRSVCEIRGRLRNSGDTALERPIVTVEIYRRSRFVVSSEVPLSIYPLAVGQSVPFDVPFMCAGGGDRVDFSGRDSGAAVQFRVAAPLP